MKNVHLFYFIYLFIFSICLGLHVKIDFSTGKKYAKLLDPNDHESSEVIIIDKNGQDSKSQKNNDTSITFHQDTEDLNLPLPIISSKHKENFRISHSDHLQFENYVSQLENSSSIQDLITALDGLEELVHELDFGIKLAKGQGIISILSLLDHDSAQVKKKAAIVIGTAMQVRIKT